MRKCALALALCAVLAASSPAFAQSGVGVIGGVNFAKIDFAAPDLSGSPIPDAEFPPAENRIGFSGGLFVTIPAAPAIGIEMDVLYSQKGAKFSSSGVTGTVKLDYLDVPVLARIGTSTAKTRLAVFAGPSFGIKLRARTKTEFPGQVGESDISTQVSAFDIGLVVGAGVESGVLRLDGRYQWGLSNIDKEGMDMKNRAFSILVGFKF